MAPSRQFLVKHVALRQLLVKYVCFKTVFGKICCLRTCIAHIDGEKVVEKGIKDMINALGAPNRPIEVRVYASKITNSVLISNELHLDRIRFL